MAGFTDDEIKAFFDAPRRVRGDQGEIEERSIDEVIKSDQYMRKRSGNRHNIFKNSVVQLSRYGGNRCG